MKIARVSKQEQEHEDREALEVLSIWKLQVGLLRTTVTAINGHTIKTVEPVPDLQEVTKVQTLKQSEGGLPSRKSCALCGLYRNERVNAVDREERHDSFGEYWDEGSVMHRLCFDFWCTFNEQLETR